MSDEREFASSNESIAAGDEDTDYEDDNESNHANYEQPNLVEGDIDDETLYKSFKVLKRMADIISNNLTSHGLRNANRKQSVADDSCHIKSKHATGSSRGAAGSSRALNRSNHKYFGDIIKSLNQRKKDIVKNYGFGFLLEYDGCQVLLDFVQWIADHVDVNCWDISVGGRMIPVTPETVHMVLGIPTGGKEIGKTGDSERDEFLSTIKQKSIPLTNYFTEKVESPNIEDDQQFFK